MTLFEKQIQQFEARPAAFGSVEEQSRAFMLQHFSAINKFEGVTPSPIDQRLFQLLAAGKISKQEYLDLCLIDARSAE
jgi:hypothetical protein